MISEVEKMYEKCNFEKSMGVGSPVVLHPFTAEKQIELIKWFIRSRHFSHIRFNIKWVVDDIANHINFIWQNLTEEEKQQVKEEDNERREYRGVKEICRVHRYEP